MLVKLKINNHKKEIYKQRSRAEVSTNKATRFIRKWQYFQIKQSSSGLVVDINNIILYVIRDRAYYAN